ncbi:hypothetical protein SK128_023957 [Halocaridina rubra]|uniref:Uncharacterized protein n=1 Tax=Halocaridina rubra TaxID=373956 RepID=A0AAN8WQK6_HALRR
MAVLVGIVVGVVAIGLTFTRTGIRINLNDMAPKRSWILVHIINIAGVFTAIFPPLIVAGLAQINESKWLAVWLIPMTFIVPSAIQYVFLLTTCAQPWDNLAGEMPPGGEVRMANGHGPPRDSLGISTARQSFKSAKSGMSFKSAMTAQTFKSAVSRNRPRTLSSRTIDEDLSVDMRSVIEEDEVHSVQESNDDDCKSANSSNTFKSDGADMHSIDLNDPETLQQQHQSGQYSGMSGDRTSTWLNYHHQVPIENSRPAASPTEHDIWSRNAIYEIFW